MTTRPPPRPHPDDAPRFVILCPYCWEVPITLDDEACHDCRIAHAHDKETH